MQIAVIVRGYSQETLKFFLGTAADMGLPISAVKSTPMGLILPVELAINAGIVEVPQPEPAKPKRASRAKKVEEPPLWDE